MTDRSGTTVRGYELKSLLGEGGFGAVYAAHQAAVKRDVALKVILPEYANHPDFIRGFETEARLVARLEHLHIVPLYDFWREPDSAYIVMRLLKGGSLRSLIEDGPQPPARVMRIVEQITAALASAHRQGVVHRDIKPDNVLFDEDGNAYLTDFGIAKDLQEAAPSEGDFLNEGLAGSPHYISPEQAQQEPVSPRSDLYSLGIVVFEMLTGATPFSGNTTMMELILKHINEPLPPINALNPDIPESVDLVIQRATDKNPTARYDSVLAFAHALRQAFPELAAPSTSADQAGEVIAQPHIDAMLVETTLPSADNPYKGLRAFEEADSDDFYGREELIGRLLKHLRHHSFLAVIGPSGSGKSSVVKAGVIPALRRDEIPDACDWFVAEMVPSADPFRELEAALLSVAVGRQPNLLNRLGQDETVLNEIIRAILPGEAPTLLLLIDQFEEIFTQIEDESVRTAFLNSLLVAVTAPQSPLRLVITLRADFYDRPLLYAGFGELVRRNSEVVLPLSRAEMEAAIVRPAENAGLNVEPALVAAIVTEVGEQPGALPLMQYALTEVFERREGNTLTVGAYQSSGGVLGALARRAEELYIQLDPGHQEIVRQLFLRLVTLGEGTEDTRRRVSVAALRAIGTDNEASIQFVLDLYGRYRLLTFDHDPETRDPTVEVAHEALIREWERLRNWLDENRDDVRIQQRLALAAQEWQRQNQDPSFLASGLRLQQFATLLESKNLNLNEDEVTYTRASLAERDRRQAEEEARQAHELTLERRAKRRAYFVAGVLVMAFVVAVILAGLALSARSDAVSARDTAEENEARAVAETERRATAEAIAVEERDQALIDESRLLSILALQQLDADPVASINLALRALPDPDAPAPRPYTPEAEFALAQAIQTSLERGYLEPFGGNSITDVLVQGEQLRVAGATLVTTTRALESSSVIGNHQNPIRELQSSDGTRWLSYDTNRVTVWAGDEIVAEHASDEALACAMLAPDGTAVALCNGPEVQIWLPESGEMLSLRPLNEAIKAAAWAPDSQSLAAWDNTELLIWSRGDSRTQTLSPAPDGHTIITAAWSPDNTGLGIVLSDFTAAYWGHEDTETFIRLAGHTDSIDGLRFLDDERLITWGMEGTARIWSRGGDMLAELGSGTSAVNGIALSPGGSTAIIWQNDGIAQLWDIASGARIANLQGQSRNILNASWRDDAYLATSDVDFTIRIWNAENGVLVATLYGHTNRISGLEWLDPEHLLSYGQDGTVRRWQVFHANGTPLGNGLVAAFEGHRGEIRVAEWLDDSTIVTAGRDGTARRWSLDTGDVITLTVDAYDRPLFVWSPDGGQVFAYSEAEGGQMWDVASQTLLYEIPGPIATGGVFWLSSGLFVGHPDGDIRWLDPATGDLLSQLTGHTAAVNHAAEYGAGKLATAGADNMILIWDLTDEPGASTLEPVRRLTNERQPVRLAWHSDGARLLSGGFNGDITLWDTDSGEILQFFTGAGDFPVRHMVTFSPDERYIAVPIESDVFVWDLDGNLVFRHAGDNAVQGVDWYAHNGSQFLLSWGLDGRLRVWHGPDGVELNRFVTSGSVLQAAFDGNGTHILSAGRSGIVEVWRAWPETAELIATAQSCCQTRSLSNEQRETFNISD
ncbi:MAG: protein kinase [Chloroflexi bacterium]|nr:protein kinase [Chloroflexota bacterium]